jgi:hypothetical protein
LLELPAEYFLKKVDGPPRIVAGDLEMHYAVCHDIRVFIKSIQKDWWLYVAHSLEASGGMDSYRI